MRVATFRWMFREAGAPRRAVRALVLCAAAAAGLAQAPSTAQTVRLQTSAGDIDIVLSANQAPQTAANFLAYVGSGFFNGLIFHRVIENFMVQAGGYTAALEPRPTRAPIALESRNGLSNLRGTVAMARTSVADSATSQFYINVVDNVFLDQANARDGHGYAVFATVVQGMDVVDRIRTTPTVSKGSFTHLPAQPITIIKAEVIKPRE